MKVLLMALIMSYVTANQGEDDYAKTIIEKTELQYRLINDYQVRMTISMKIPAFRMPKKKYTVFFKQPDKIKIKSKGFGLLPRTGMFTSPSENFDNLTDIVINKDSLGSDSSSVMLRGNLIVDSLAIKMPNDYAKVTFKPTVDVTIDTSQWVITGVVTKIDTIKIMQINNEYGYNWSKIDKSCNGCFAAGINFGASIISLFYGEGDFKETIKIAVAQKLSCIYRIISSKTNSLNCSF